MSDKKALTLSEQAAEIIKIAEAAGVQTNFFFITTFKRYQVQIGILNELEKRIKEDGALVTKEYVKGRGNIYTHPAIREYTSVSDSANKTVSTLMKIIKGFNEPDNDAADIDPLLAIINGGQK